MKFKLIKFSNDKTSSKSFMHQTNLASRIVLILGFILFFGSQAYAQSASSITLATLTDVQKYYRAIHIMAMLLLGFGFLMVFVRKYGRSALTATFLLVSVSIPAYFYLASLGIFGDKGSEIDTLILAEFAAASLLITAGAILGRLEMYQYILLGLLFVPAYMLNEWINLSNGFDLIKAGSFVDVGGSIVIHAFGAIFGLSAAYFMTTANERNIEIESDYTSDRFSMLGSMFLWVFWPSFCAALVIPSEVIHTAINVILALCGATVSTYFFTTWLRGKIDAADIANASLAGGVAIGTICNIATSGEAILVGLVAGALSVIGFELLQSGLQKRLKLVDTCGVSNLHGIPGLFGGLVALFVIKGIDVGAQLSGIAITIAVAVVSGMITGKILSLTGRCTLPYSDSEEFDVAE